MAAHLAMACSFVRSLTHAQNELAAAKVAGLAPSLPDNGGLPGARSASGTGLICAAHGRQQGVRLEDLYEWPERVPVCPVEPVRSRESRRSAPPLRA